MTDQLPYLTQSQPDRPSPFSPKVPILQTLWDSVSIGTLKTCPRKYQLSILEGWQKSGGIPPLEYGIFLHAGLEYLDKAIAWGTEPYQALKESIRHVMKISGGEQETIACAECHEEFSETPDYCGHCGSEEFRPILRYRPWYTSDNRRNIQTLVRALVWYYDAYIHHEGLRTYQFPDGTPAVELTFKYSLDWNFPHSKEPILLAGHLDKVVLDPQGRLFVLDRKTTGGSLNDNFFRSFSPHNQMSGYTFAGKIIFDIPVHGCIIDGIELGVNYNRFRRGETHRTDSQLSEWIKSTIHWITLAEEFARQNYWPMNEESCTKYGGCPFQEICGKTPEVRHRYLQADFVRRPWNPAEER